jgi:hypothetical protein
MGSQVVSERRFGRYLIDSGHRAGVKFGSEWPELTFSGSGLRQDCNYLMFEH